MRRLAVGIRGIQRFGKGARKGPHGRGIVPEMRVGPRPRSHQRSHHDVAAANGRRGREQLLHPGIVIGAVGDRDGGLRQRAGNGWTGFEQMRILVGIRQDAVDPTLRAGDLTGDITVEIFRRHDMRHRRPSP
jgi:hypothetical protein